MMSVAFALRSERGFRLIWIRPLLIVVLVPSIPMNDDRLSTPGSFRIVPASASWRSFMALKETVCDPSEMPRITPVSCTGKNPLGMTRKRNTVVNSVATATTSVAVWWRRTTVSVRP